MKTVQLSTWLLQQLDWFLFSSFLSDFNCGLCAFSQLWINLVKSINSFGFMIFLTARRGNSTFLQISAFKIAGQNELLAMLLKIFLCLSLLSNFRTAISEKPQIGINFTFSSTWRGLRKPTFRHKNWSRLFSIFLTSFSLIILLHFLWQQSGRAQLILYVHI